MAFFYMYLLLFFLRLEESRTEKNYKIQPHPRSNFPRKAKAVKAKSPTRPIKAESLFIYINDLAKIGGFEGYAPPWAMAPLG